MRFHRAETALYFLVEAFRGSADCVQCGKADECRIHPGQNHRKYICASCIQGQLPERHFLPLGVEYKWFHVYKWIDKVLLASCLFFFHKKCFYCGYNMVSYILSIVYHKTERKRIFIFRQIFLCESEEVCYTCAE